jgi:hypothetical protein
MSNNLTPLLLTKDDFLEDKLIPSITELVKLEKCIRDAQEEDLRPLMGDRFYTDMILNFSLNDSDVTHIYVPLMRGEDYEDSDGYTIHFSGLRMALKNWTYARYIAQVQFNVTSHSVVNKLQDNSQLVSSKTIAAQVEAARSMAVSYWADVVKYLKVKYASYPLWTGQKTTPRGSFRIRVGGKNN